MILKRWALNFVAVVAGFLIGLFIVLHLQQQQVVPGPVVMLVCTMSVGLSFLGSYALGLSLFPTSADELIRPEIPRQPWAWLRPRGEGLRSGFPLNKSHVLIGRDVSCDVMLNHDSVSRRHAEVVRLAEGYLFRDLSSKNGSFVNGQRIQEYLLQEGDVVSCGDVQLNFEAPRRAEPVELEEAEHLSVSQLLSPEALPLDQEMPSGDPREDEEEGTEVWRRPE